ncbi:MAG: TonB-dependent receptor, partial [Candidatus Solibacter usitatus]|nr:TonB-dependent receptor [Candidatus Solibacter usitatus]
SINRGGHSWKMGTQILVRYNHSESHTFFSGRFTFGELPGALVSPALASTSINGLQAFRLGIPQSYQQGFGDPVVAATYPLYAFFFQDTWKPTANLTLNYGLRYEVDTRKEPLPTDRNNFAPRFGFAWDPANNKKTILRGGYGMFYAPTDYQIDYVVNALNEINGYRQIAQVLSPITTLPPPARNGPVNIFQTLRAQGVIGVPTPTRSIQASDLAQFGIAISQTGPRPPLTVLFKNSPNFVNSYSQQASFGIERELASGLSVQVSYIWARALKITRARDDNLLPAPVSPTLGVRVWSAAFFKQPLLYQDNVYESTGRSFYNGGMIEVTKRLSRRATFHFNYTFSKAMDEVLDFNSDFQPNDQTNLRAERSLSAFDQRHKVVAYGVFQTPRGKGFFSDFTCTPIFRANSARPFNLLTGFDLNADRHSTTDRPRFAGRNTGIGPAFWTFDGRLSRRIPMGEQRALELMAEGFNLFNHLNLGSVNNTVGDMPGPFRVEGRRDRTPSQPLGFTAAYDARRVQLGLRFSF